MPRVSFAQEFKSNDIERFPKLKLDTGEKSRLWIPKDEEPWMEWSHRIEAPVIEHGEPVMEVKETRRGPIETWKMDWIGNVFCLGETGTPESPGPLMTAGIDPGNCPACESAANKTGVSPPAQRFATNVIKYKVRGRGPSPYELASPISAEILIWAYTARVAGLLYELGSEHGDLHRHDLKYELEDSPGADKYQKMKQLAIIVKPAYADPKVREYLGDLWMRHPENRASDDQLRDACQGRDVPRVVLLDMVRRAERQYRDAERGGHGVDEQTDRVADAGFNGDLSEGIDSLLDSGAPSDATADSGDAGQESLKDPWAAAEDSEDQREAVAAVKRQVQAGDPLEEFMSDEQKRQIPKEIAEVSSPDDPFWDGTSPVTGATTTSTSAPAAEPPSRTAPKSAEPAPGSEPAKANGRKKAAAKADPEPAKATEPATGGKGSVIDFDDLFSD